MSQMAPKQKGQKKLTINVDKSRANMERALDSGIAMGSPVSMGPEKVSSTSNTIIVNGSPLTVDRLMNMGAALQAARTRGDFPSTITPDYDTQALIDDHARLVQIQAARGDAPRSRWEKMPEVAQLMVTITRDIRDRDAIRRDKVQHETMRARVNNMVNNAETEDRVRNVLESTFRNVMRAGGNRQAVGNDSFDMSAVLQDIRQQLGNMATAQENGVYTIMTQMRNTVQARVGQQNPEITGVDMEAVVETVFETIEAALLDAAGPLRLNVSHMDGQIMHLDAIGSHVNAIDGHVNSLGNNINSMGHLVNSTNTNVTAISTQVGVLQTVVQMLPDMISRIIQDILPGAVQEAVQAAVTQIITARLQGLIGTGKGGRAALGSFNGHDMDTTDDSEDIDEKKRGKKRGTIKRFFGKLFGKSSFKDDQDDGSASIGFTY